jgi:hypothetical protein
MILDTMVPYFVPVCLAVARRSELCLLVKRRIYETCYDCCRGMRRRKKGQCVNAIMALVADHILLNNAQKGYSYLRWQ